MTQPLGSAIIRARFAAERALRDLEIHAQEAKLTEEIGELLTALGRIRYARASNTEPRAKRCDVVEECADVIVTALSIAAHYSDEGNAWDVQLAEMITAKAERLNQRLIERYRERMRQPIYCGTGD